jgi:endonuclease/exonuclease/phosphatase family metal-dependent hydrolase
VTARLRIVTWNIELGRDAARAAEVLRSREALRDADVIVLQELHDDAVAEIAGRLGMQRAYHPADVHPRTRRNFGNAILSRWPVSEDRLVRLPHPSWVDGFRRAAVTATVHAGPRRIRVYAVHLSHLLEIPYWRITDQLRAVERDAAGSGDPVVIAGDLNSLTAGHMLVRRGYRWVTRGIGPTRRFFSIDHVFVRNLPATAARAGVVRDRLLPGDHRPVWAVVGLGATSSART